ncbi:DNA-directed RNA polymerase I subunit RPA2 [Nematocida displodere]|uniref:DNA-directed RNA polymerase subunit beta n=1 Tax=Nematocida displodere TaxID=1805483 RepID=A0A177ELC4_9MICR|nr:DNA-directed RNA polymerase I subunit RPA2 [Nematocida displodere]OAG32271.1 DNA-directed RNA polymerase I subunit RPA2 [Nematocida displodere]
MSEEAERLAFPHINSYNRFVAVAIPRIVRNFEPVTVNDGVGNTLTLSLDSICVDSPEYFDPRWKGPGRKTFPYECRITSRPYQGKITATVIVSINGNPTVEHVQIGHLPVMVKSDLCHLSAMDEAGLLKAKEDMGDLGGYFVHNGLEKLCRLIQTQKKYLPVGVYRPSMAKKIKNMSEYAVTFRSHDKNGCASQMALHYLTDHSIRVKIKIRKREYFIPLPMILRALSGKTDKEIHRSISAALGNDPGLVEYATLLLQSFSCEKRVTQTEAISYLGARFKLFFEIGAFGLHADKKTSESKKILNELPKDIDAFYAVLEKYTEISTHAEYGRKLINAAVAVHTDDFEEKYQVVILCVAKLLMVVAQKVVPDNSDSLDSHELITVGDIFTEILAEKVDIIRHRLVGSLLGHVILHNGLLTSSTFLKRAFKYAFIDITSTFGQLLSTGNLVLRNSSNFAMMQQTGFSIQAERLNYWRFFSHFRSVHRGAYFEEIRTTSIRKLLPESWGFLCPVHTPDGAPCGLLTHLAHQCEISHLSHRMPIHELVELGMLLAVGGTIGGVPVVQNGVVLGSVTSDLAPVFVQGIRKKKIQNKKMVYLEVFYQNHAGVQPAVILVNTPNRMMRPVLNIRENAVEYIGTTEQAFLQIENLGKTKTTNPTHRELDAANMLSVVAGSTPLGNFNPSPRNIYQCQMAKQSMGTPLNSQKYRTDQKTYVLDSPQVPILLTDIYKKFNLERYPIGKNIMIAIVSYTGYDIEDAVVINKASVNRGFMRGAILKTEEINLKKEKTKTLGTLMGDDGLPSIGASIKDGDEIYTVVDNEVMEEVKTKNKSMEDLRVESVAVFDTEDGKRGASIRFRIPRLPAIGDKFSSRHGQKGVCSILYEDEDMPFSESGITPDLIINPHAFPSRMSMGMFIENIATKVGAYSGELQDGSMFSYGEDGPDAHVYFGDKLESYGFRRGGGETLYSGITGKPLKVDIFFGMVYYQRLRHMVGDKYQVRTVGPVHNLTKQPIGGRKRAGGIRLGEMERDALISHGATTIIQDRMMACSDGAAFNVCKHCNTLCFFNAFKCTGCQSPKALVRVAFPYVFKYLVAELAAMNIGCRMKFKGI